MLVAIQQYSAEYIYQVDEVWLNLRFLARIYFSLLILKMHSWPLVLYYYHMKGKKGKCHIFYSANENVLINIGILQTN